MIPEDPIDRLIEQWQLERPELDLAPMALMARLLRVAGRVERAVGDGLAEGGLQTGWFDVLSALRRAPEPHRLTPGRLAASVMLSTGGMTKRLDRLEEAGLVRRSPDPDDRRGVLVGLTAKGRRVADAAVEAHLDNERRMLAGLTRAERAELERLLDKLGASIAAARPG